MKPLISLLFLIAGASQLLGGSPVDQVVLDPLRPVRVLVSLDHLTTVQFPGPISDIEGAYVSPEADAPARFQITFRTNSHFFSLRAITTNATASLNVVWKNKTYVLELTESDSPVLSLILVDPALPARLTPSHTMTTNRLQEIIRIAKYYPLIQRFNPDLLKQVQRATPKLKTSRSGFEQELTEVFRFESDDTLVFHLTLHNQGREPILYLPKTLTAKVDGRRFRQSLTDADGVMAPNGASEAYFAITGGMNGAPPRLSLTNQFQIDFELLPTPGSVQPARIATTAPRPTQAAPARQPNYYPATAYPAVQSPQVVYQPPVVYQPVQVIQYPQYPVPRERVWHPLPFISIYISR